MNFLDLIYKELCVMEGEADEVILYYANHFRPHPMGILWDTVVRDRYTEEDIPCENLLPKPCPAEPGRIHVTITNRLFTDFVLWRSQYHQHQLN